MTPIFRTLRMTFIFAILMAAITSIQLAACSGRDTVDVSYEAYNHTATHINSVIVNGEGGIMDAMAYSGGSSICCVTFPSKWRPGLTAVIKWEEDGGWLKDERGNAVIHDGVPEYVKLPYKEKVIEIPEYASGDQMGEFRIHFFQNDDVRVTILPFGIGHKNYPYPAPIDPKLK